MGPWPICLKVNWPWALFLQANTSSRLRPSRVGNSSSNSWRFVSRGERSGRPQAALTRSAWEETILAPARARTPDRSAAFLTTSGYPIDVVYTPDDVESGHSLVD